MDTMSLKLDTQRHSSSSSQTANTGGVNSPTTSPSPPSPALTTSFHHLNPATHLQLDPPKADVATVRFDQLLTGITHLGAEVVGCFVLSAVVTVADAVTSAIVGPNGAVLYFRGVSVLLLLLANSCCLVRVLFNLINLLAGTWALGRGTRDRRTPPLSG